MLDHQVAGVSAWGQDASLLSHSSYGATVGWQCLAVLVTLMAASIGGTLAGVIVSTVNPAKQHLGPHQLFDDGAFWTVSAALSVRREPARSAAVLDKACPRVDCACCVLDTGQLQMQHVGCD